MTEWFEKLFGADLMPQGESYLWSPGLVWLHAVSDGLIALAYFSIPLTLVYFVRRRNDIPYPALFIMFGAFIVACGTTHAFGVWTIWHGDYLLAGGVKAVTASISLATAVALVWVMPQALQLTGPEKLQQLNESLEARVGRRTAALEAANALLRNEVAERKKETTRRLEIEKKMQEAQKLESLGVLAGGIAHDFNNLLTGILGNTSLVRLDLPRESPIAPALDGIEHAARRAADLCNQMLAYAGRGRFVVESLDLNEIVRDTTGLLKASIRKSSSLHFNLAESLPAITADATQLRQIVMNLVINASEAIGKHSGSIAITTGTVRLRRDDLLTMRHESEMEPGEHVFLEVSDSGSGMEADTKNKIFDPFFTTKFSGRGLGLAAVLGIVRSQKGGLQVHSEPGHGTTFKIFLPADPAPAPAASTTAIQETDTSVTPSSGVVLVIDDEEPVRTVASRVLKTMGLTAELADDGYKGLEKFGAHPQRYDIVLLDLTMPRLDGEAVFRRLRRIRPNIPVLLMSGFTEQEVTSRFDGQDIAGFLKKPFDMASITTAIGKILPAG